MAKAPKSYKALENGYLSTEGRYINAGEVFTTSDFDVAEKKPLWAEEISDSEAVALDAINTAMDPKVDADPDYSQLSVAQLQSVAATKKIAFEGLSKKDLVKALQAEHAPTA